MVVSDRAEDIHVKEGLLFLSDPVFILLSVNVFASCGLLIYHCLFLVVEGTQFEMSLVAGMAMLLTCSLFILRFHLFYLVLEDYNLDTFQKEKDPLLIFLGMNLSL